MIGVIGIGVVGHAVYQGFKQAKMQVFAYDKYKPEFNELSKMFSARVIFVCVPTPTVNGRQDLTALEDTFQMLSDIGFKGVICVKSTVLPGTTQKLSAKYDLVKVVHNPEFLTAAKPFEDFMNQPAVVLGGHPNYTLDVANAYRRAGFTNIVELPEARASELVKYMHNLFLSVKVSFLNEFYDACESMKVDYELVRHVTTIFGGIGHGHTMVPGPDGKRGFGGMCFPKDTEAFSTFAKDRGVKMDVLEAAIIGNKRRRDDV
jgi:UDPglucose 6-dehydrogenase